MVRSRIALVSALSAMLYINGLQAADVSMDNEKSLSDSGEWSEQSLAKGKNEAIDKDSVETLPPSLREIWMTQSTPKPKQIDRSRFTKNKIADEIIPRYGVQYVTEQRNFSRAEDLYHTVRKFLTDLNIKVMAGELGRRAPVLSSAKTEKGSKPVAGDVELVEHAPLAEEVRINELHNEMLALRGRISYPNLLERDHFNEIAGDLAKAQGLINYDLTEEGIKRIDEQYAAWKVLIEVARMRAIEAYTDQLIEEDPDLTRERARRQAENADIEFKLPPLPMGEFALRDARAELNRMHDVRAPEKTNQRKKEREEQKEMEKQPEVIELEDPAKEDMATEDAEDDMTEMVDESVEETAPAMEEKTEAAESNDLDIEVEDFDVDADETETPAMEEKTEAPVEVEEDNDEMMVEDEPAVEEKAEEKMEEKEEKKEEKSDDGFDFEDDFSFD